MPRIIMMPSEGPTRLMGIRTVQIYVCSCSCSSSPGTSFGSELRLNRCTPRQSDLLCTSAIYIYPEVSGHSRVYTIMHTHTGLNNCSMMICIAWVTAENNELKYENPTKSASSPHQEPYMPYKCSARYIRLYIFRAFDYLCLANYISSSRSSPFT